MASSLEPAEAKESTREVIHSLTALEQDLEAAREGHQFLTNRTFLGEPLS